MRTPKRVLTAAVVAIAALAALGFPAVAAPMPWDSHEVPAAGAPTAESGMVSVLCSGNC